jgi:hypothetical protein
MAVNMQQIKNVGKATALDIKQFAFAGINIYGALAAATGKTTAQVEDLDVSYDLLSFALKKAASAGGLYEGGLSKMSKSTAVQISNLGDSLLYLKDDIFTGLKPAIDIIIQGLAGMINLGRDAVSWLKEHSTAVKTAAVFIGTLAAGIAIYNAISYAMVAIDTIKYMWMMRSVIATTLMTNAQWLLNAAMYANPIGLVVVGIAALVAGIYLAWQKFEGFRLVVMGLWGAVKQVFTNIGAYFKTIFEPIFEAIQAFKDGRYLDMGKAVAKLAFNLSPAGLIYNAKDLGKGVGDAYDTGYGLQEQEEYFNKKKKAKDAKLAEGGSSVGMPGANPYSETAGIPSADKAGKGGGGGNKIDVKINTLATINFMVTDAKNDINKIKSLIKGEVERTLIGAVNDFQTAAGR